MKKRNTPFGYRYENGVICVSESETETLRQIFNSYISGMSLSEIAEKLNGEKAEYMPGITGWNKARLMRIIEDKRYTGSDGYPAIIATNIHEKLNQLKRRRNTQEHTDRSSDIFKMDMPVMCPNCGCKMQRRHDARCKVSERWFCRNAKCKTLIAIADDSLLQGITASLNTVVQQPDIIAVVESDREPSNDIRRLNAEISHTLGTYSIQKDDLRKKMMNCVSLKYAEIPTEKYISKKMKADFERSSPLSSFPADLCKKTVKSVHIGTDGTVSLTLMNNQKIGKEQAT